MRKSEKIKAQIADVQNQAVTAELDKETLLNAGAIDTSKLEAVYLRQKMLDDLLASLSVKLAEAEAADLTEADAAKVKKIKEVAQAKAKLLTKILNGLNDDLDKILSNLAVFDKEYNAIRTICFDLCGSADYNPLLAAMIPGGYRTFFEKEIRWIWSRELEKAAKDAKDTIGFILPKISDTADQVSNWLQCKLDERRISQ